MVENGKHMVILSVDRDLWQKFGAVIAPLRAEYLLKWHPIVILSPYEPPTDFVKDFQDIIVVKGNPQKLKHLELVIAAHCSFLPRKLDLFTLVFYVGGNPLCV